MFVENVLPKHLPGFCKTSFENINENHFSNISLEYIRKHTEQMFAECYLKQLRNVFV